jgi:hypothetical protein
VLDSTYCIKIPITTMPEETSKEPDAPSKRNKADQQDGISVLFWRHGSNSFPSRFDFEPGTGTKYFIIGVPTNGIVENSSAVKIESAECLSIFEISKVFFIVLSFSKPVPTPDDFEDTLEIRQKGIRRTNETAFPFSFGDMAVTRFGHASILNLVPVPSIL